MILEKELQGHNEKLKFWGKKEIRFYARKNEQARTAKIMPHASAVNAGASEWRIPRNWKTTGSSFLMAS